jgi:hypothetical protein
MAARIARRPERRLQIVDAYFRRLRAITMRWTWLVPS